MQKQWVLNEIITVLSLMLQDLPNVSIGKHFHNTNFLVGKKVFTFIKDDNVVVKLPKEKITELVEKKYAISLVMGKRVMKEWVVIKHKNPEEYKKDLKLFKEAIAF